MAKYRPLTDNELTELRDEFVDYLVVNGIDAQSWGRIKDEEPEKARKIIELFSDVVFEKVLRKTDYIYMSSGSVIYAFHYDSQEASMFVASFDTEEHQNLTVDDLSLDSIKNLGMPQSLSFQSKPYNVTREEELFKMLSSGCLPAKADVYTYLQSLYTDRNR